ncbi:hypothetical protein G7046_g9658 [Stylonectria norvegica]|nr:hypothetical protein G7046_g9658 [Stylonectria norvegica]
MPRRTIQLGPSPVFQRHSFKSTPDQGQNGASRAMFIRPLPEDVVDKLKSSVVITTLNAVACGLLTNSLDAGASKVNLSIDYTRGNCTVEDNGFGIHPDEFDAAGGLGKLHHTSKYPPRPSIHGTHGDFLASVATLSLLSVSSRHRKHASQNSISIHNSKILARHRPSPPGNRLVNFDHGTRVAVRDLFGSMPVRVKQRVTSAEASDLEKEWSRLVRDVVALLLAWPVGVHISLRDAVTQRELRFRPSETSDILSRTSRLLTQASLADPGDLDAWVPISASSGNITVKGCICATPVATRRSQFISLGIAPLTNDRGVDVLYEEINKAFGNSSFGVIEGDEGQLRNATKHDSFTAKELRSRKAIERWPMFYIKVTSTGEDAGLGERLERHEQGLTAILDLLKALCYGFLKKNHFRPRKIHLSPIESVFSTLSSLGRSKRHPASFSRGSRSRSTSASQDSALASMSTRSGSPFDGWHHVKTGRATPRLAAAKAADTQTKIRKGTFVEPLTGEGGKLLRKPFDEPSPDRQSTISPLLGPNPDIKVLTGGPSSSKTFEDAEPGSPLQKHRRIENKPKPQLSQWLQNVERSWENPVFETIQITIPRAYEESVAQPPMHGASHNCDNNTQGGILFESASMNFNGRVSKHAIPKATVISQVDRKFILVKIPLEGMKPSEDGHEQRSSSLVVLDQHAVDERCRLEDLMTEYFTQDAAIGGFKPVVEALDRPLVFEVSRKECSLLDLYREHFTTWGINYKVKIVPNQALKGNEVSVAGLPPSILERCRLEPRLLIEMLRKEIWRIVDEGAPTRSRRFNSETETPWISNFHGCPQGILEMLHSRACRSAIMFNDLLTKDDCEQLLARLAKCAFPFQCAHGRPSVAPLIDLGMGGRFGGWQEWKGEDGGKWKKWIEGK